MIYTRFGGEVRIVGNCGEQKLRLFKFIPIDLLKIEYLNEDKEPIGEYGYYFKDLLKAEGGWEEIQQAVKCAPVIELKGKELKQAIQKAM